MKRDILIFIVALAALLGSFATAASTTSERNYQLRGYVDAAQDANLPFRIPRLGVNAELFQYSRVELKRQLDLMQASHIYWVRQVLRWDEIEPQRGAYKWDAWDELIQTLSAYPDLHLVVVLMNTPAWARVDGKSDNKTTPPKNYDDITAFAGAFASRYGQSVDDYQIWDEPNLTTAWGGQEPRVANYVAMLSSAYTAIHNADSSATVISAALAPTTELGLNNISDIRYLNDMYALGAKDYMDAVAAKPYGFNTSPEDRSVSPAQLNFSRIIALREEMIQNGDGHKALWASNWGWNSLPDGWTGKPSIWGSVSSANQVTYTLTALDRADREWPWLGGMILQHWQPDAAQDDPQWGFTVIDQNDKPTPLWDALVARPQVTSAANGLFAAANSFAHYSGVWKFSKLGADVGWVQDSQFDFDFTGTSAALLLRQADYTAYLYPTVDGQPANAVPRDSSGNAYIILTSGSLLPETNLIPVAAHLPPGDHTLHVTTDRGWDRWAIAGFAVSSSDLASPYNRQIGIGWISTFAAALAVLVTGWRIRPTFKPVLALVARLNATSQLILSLVSSVLLLIGMMLTWGDGIPNFFRRDPIPLGLAIATAGLIKLQPGIVLTIIAVLILLVIFYHRLDIGLTLTIFLAPFFLFPVELYRFAFPLSEVIILLTSAAWLLRMLIHWASRRKNGSSETSLRTQIAKLSALDYAVMAWVILGCISLLWSAYLKEATTDLRVMILEPALFYAIFRTSRLDSRAIIRIVDALLMAGLAVALIGLLQFVRGDAIITAEGDAHRMASVYGSPNNVGLFLGRCVPFLLAFALVKTDKRRRMLCVAAVIPTGIAVLLSQSVGAIFVGVPAAVLAVCLLSLGRRAIPFIVGFVVVAIIAFIVALQFPRFARVLDFTSGTNFIRLRVWESALNIIHDHPITGLGMDQFLYAFRGHYILPDAWQEPSLSHPHNLLLDFWVRLGIAGVLLLTAFQVAFWRSVRRAYTGLRTENPLHFALLIGLIGSMVDLIAHGLIDNSIYVQDLAYVFVLLLALAAWLGNARPIDEALI